MKELQDVLLHHVPLIKYKYCCQVERSETSRNYHLKTRHLTSIIISRTSGISNLPFST